MSETILKCFDRKGDPVEFSARGVTAPAAADLATFLTGKSYVGCREYSTVTPGTLGLAKVVVVADVVENDADYKAVISYKDVSEPTLPTVRKLIIPAPTLNIANGICCVVESDSQVIPAIPPDGAVGLGGNQIITAWETTVGATAGDFIFLSGGFVKKRR